MPRLFFRYNRAVERQVKGMSLVGTSDLKAGMVLSDHLMTPGGKRILSKGSVLTDKNISMMKVWGIAYADVEGSEEDRSTNLDGSQTDLRGEWESIVRSYFPQPLEGLQGELFGLCCQRYGRLFAVEDRRSMEEIARHNSPQTMPSRLGLEEDRPRLSEMVGKEVALTSLPDVYFKIMDVIKSPISSAASIAKVVSTDPNLSLRLLRLVNSAFYGFPVPIRSISRAIAIVGIRELSSLALAVSTMNAFSHIPSEYVDMRSFWRHSIACGVISRVLASHRKIHRDETFFLAGLLHDIGRALMYIKLPSWMAHGLGVSRFFRLPLLEVEKRLLGFDHGQVTFKLLSQWNIPEPILGLASWHHEPEKHDRPDEAALIWLADWMANAMKVGSSETYFLPPAKDDLWKMTGLEVETLGSVFLQSERQINEILRIFLMA